ncbi:Phosphopentomutase [Candidatus Hepatincolaceae symbiont of Richtersius coronifer]
MKRAIILLLDSLGVGSSKDAVDYKDEGANTLGHILEQFPQTHIPNLKKLGLINCLKASCGSTFDVAEEQKPLSYYGYAKEISKGKDTVTGHWELTGAPMLQDWGYFNNATNSFPQDFIDNLVKKANLTGYLGNCVASGTEIIDKYGVEHIKTKKPIFYTSADSVFQIAAHEESFGLQALYDLCKLAREDLYQYNIGRVIARPFIGTTAGDFERTGNRKDYSIQPPNPTLLDIMKEAKGEVISIGKISDIFASRGITKAVKSSTLPHLFDDTLKIVKENKEFSIVFTNFVDFDSSFGHRRDVKGYKEALEYFDSRLPELLKELNDEDLLIIIADHGNDPSWPGTDHTREHIPVIFYNKKWAKDNLSFNIGERSTFSDVGQSIASYLGIKELLHGESFLKGIK